VTAPRGRETLSAFAERAAWAIAVAAVGATVVLAGLGPTREPDVFWHMAVARDALATRSLLPGDPYSFSFAGAPWRHKDLLSELVLYGAFRALGYTGFAVFKMACAAALVAALACTPGRAHRRALGLTIVGGLTLTSFWYMEQPAAFSLVLLGVLLMLFERARRHADATSTKALLATFAPLVLVTWAWTWLHRFALAGHVLVVGFAVDAWLSRMPWGPRGRALMGEAVPSRFAMAATAAAGLGPLFGLLNPSGVAAFTSVATMVTHPELRQQFYEWKSAPLTEIVAAFPVACGVTLTSASWVAARLVRAALSRSPAPVRPWHAAVIVGTWAAAAVSARWVPFAAVASLSALAVLTGEYLASSAWLDLCARWIWVAPALVALVGAGLFARLRDQQGPGSLAPAEDRDFFPAGALAFAREHGLAGDVANAFDFGGYLVYWAWPGTRVLVDGRNETLYPPDFVVRALRAEHDASTFDAMRSLDGVTWALGVNWPGKPGFGFLARDPRWSLVYWSEAATVYVRRDAHPELEERRYGMIDPLRLQDSVVEAVRRARHDPGALRAAQAEIDRMRADSPGSVRAATLLVLFHALQGEAHKVALGQALDELSRVGAHDPEAMHIVAELRGSTGGQP
jgi:hypothetical protein